MSWHWHRWTRWSDPKWVQSSRGFTTIQRRHCRICNKVKIREVTA